MVMIVLFVSENTDKDIVLLISIKGKITAYGERFTLPNLFSQKHYYTRSLISST